MDFWLKIFLGGAALGMLLGFLIERGFLSFICDDGAKD